MLMTNTPDLQTIVLTLRRFGLSQNEIARQTGIPQPRLSRWEAGEYPSSADDAIRLLDLMRRLERGQRKVAAA